MNTALKATSVRDLKDAARAINFVLKNKIKGKAAVAALCDLLEVTARTVREESVGYVPHTVRKAAAKRVKPESASCCLCLDEITGHGHNAAPVNDGRCCDDCNTYVVIPARVKAMYEVRS